MKKFKITSYDADVIHHDTPAFYILSRGLSAGMPTPDPYKHSVSFYCEVVDRNDYYYYIYCLWKADIFRELMSFDQIPELSPVEIFNAIEKNIKIIDDLELCINRHYDNVEEVDSVVPKMKILEATKNHLLFKK